MGTEGVHLVYKYRSATTGKRDYNGLRIEIQLRSRLQHAWAAAVETVSAFTSQALKSNIGTEQWKRFFVLMACAIGMREHQPIVPNATPNGGELVRELTTLEKELDVRNLLSGWAASLRILPS